MTEISSATNPQFKLWKSLLTSKGIKKEGLFLLSGSKLIAEIARQGRFEIQAELVPLRGEPQTQAPRTYFLESSLFRELDELGTHHSLLVLKTPAIVDWDPSVLPSGLQVLSPLGDPQNLGALVRSAEAFGAESVVLLEESANPFLPKSIKASAGSVLRMTLFRGPRLTDLTGRFVALDLAGTRLTDYKWTRETRILIGEEGPGLRALGREAKIDPISIPTSGVESLNAGVAAGIALFHYRSQFPSAK